MEDSNERLPAKASKDAPSPKTKSEAEWAYERVIQYLRNFEAQLDNAHEVALGFTGSNAGVLQIEGLGFYEPDIVTFYGIDEEGLKTQLIQHVSQLNVILRAVPKRRSAEPPRRIGFHMPTGWVGGESGDGSV
ncbi:MAG: DUF6173 family protein [Pseudotabrizicola sp.]|uniref:DUF6173 family protein n=1 Tax=Pseudotabrizicola sp. TaxID=2939647 RepID=UPI0027189534|nr:DUF6173 family protein [Pseudotabrizicola sp.]MDO8881478.1 DUF6173 family protein [Pseudotabrizicola sp.]MDP2082193.1 DUF6173 family protein [Pseudotabrizicola sp.]MDZ7573232.1 DUF6173 family protein [Pseudotabrizicola sp.]